jgi:hypothetical protein
MTTTPAPLTTPATAPVHERASDWQRYTCACGTQVWWCIHYNGVQECAVFQYQGQGVRLCPGCGKRLVWPVRWDWC